MYLISFKDAQFAYTFIDYMETKSIVITIESDSEGNFKLFLDDHYLDQLDYVQTELKSFIDNPYEQHYSNASWSKSGGKNNILKFNNTRMLPKLIDTGAITAAVSIICIVVYLISIMTNYWTAIEYLGFPYIAEYKLQIWRYLTPIFIHFGILHIAFNLSLWWYLGGMVELFRSKFKLIEILIIAGLLSNYAQFIASGPIFGGLSGVIYALISYVALYGQKRPSSGIRLERAMFIFAILWLIGGYIGILNDMANTAHLVGLLVGLLLAAKDIWLIKK